MAWLLAYCPINHKKYTHLEVTHNLQDNTSYTTIIKLAPTIPIYEGQWQHKLWQVLLSSVPLKAFATDNVMKIPSNG